MSLGKEVLSRLRGAGTVAIFPRQRDLLYYLYVNEIGYMGKLKVWKHGGRRRRRVFRDDSGSSFMLVAVLKNNGTTGQGANTQKNTAATATDDGRDGRRSQQTLPPTALKIHSPAFFALNFEVLSPKVELKYR
ncbi:hypothetical protein DFH07DRAFT_771900 [Mycena maculata]|uniref:Uncharacterized protein n=1 Tax=Mycena maculata TaxID=230809 RepID=A0AAD7JB95_9AGAR|nr:hypothetical protein DFH07DRAFT_771900 [Mycena maculata]